MRFLELIPENIQSQVSNDLNALAGSRILITGGTGFWGTSLLYALQELQASQNSPSINIDILSRNPESFLASHPELQKLRSLNFIKGDLNTLFKQKENWDFVFHFAATDLSKELFEKLDPANLSWKPSFVAESEKLTKFFAAHVKKKTFLASSGAVYRPNVLGKPQAELSVTEIQRYDLPTVYAEKKRILETLFFKSEMNVVIGRGFASYGPFLPLDSHYAIGNFMNCLKYQKPIVLKSTGQAVRGMLESADLALWLWTILSRSTDQVYHLGSDQEVKVIELAEKIANLSPKALEIQLGEAPPDGVRDYYVPAITNAKQLGLDVWASLDAGLTRMRDWI